MAILLFLSEVSKTMLSFYTLVEGIKMCKESKQDPLKKTIFFCNTICK